jgi:hypothetical protein
VVRTAYSLKLSGQWLLSEKSKGKRKVLKCLPIHIYIGNVLIPLKGKIKVFLNPNFKRKKKGFFVFEVGAPEAITYKHQYVVKGKTKVLNSHVKKQVQGIIPFALCKNETKLRSRSSIDTAIRNNLHVKKMKKG